MLATLAKSVRASRLLSPETVSGLKLRQNERGKVLMLFGAGVRNFCGSSTLCAKARGVQKKNDVTEKKLVSDSPHYVTHTLNLPDKVKGFYCNILLKL